VKKFICLDNFFGDGWFEKRGIAIATRAEDEAMTLATLIERVYGKAPKVKLRRYKDVLMCLRKILLFVIELNL
jgi:hypothetical protein